jgi:hypothetical protein
MEKERERLMIKRPFAVLCSLFLTLALLAGLAACGKREWPTPKLSEDRFRIRSVHVQRAQNCIIVDCELAGSWQNLSDVRLLIEAIGTESGDGCAQCPFTPRIVRLFGPGAPNLRQDMNRVVITACDLDPKKTYRLQVVAGNIYPALEVVKSELAFTPPQ